MNQRFITANRYITSFSTLSKRNSRIKRQKSSPAKPVGCVQKEESPLLAKRKPCSKQLLDISFCPECAVCPTLNPTKISCSCVERQQPFLCKRAVLTAAFYHWRVTGKQEKLGKFLRDWMSRGRTSSSSDYVFVNEYGFEIPRYIGMEGNSDEFTRLLADYMITNQMQHLLDEDEPSEPEPDEEPPKTEFNPHDWNSLTEDQWCEFFRWTPHQYKVARLYKEPAPIIDAYFAKRSEYSLRQLFPDPVMPISTAAALGLWRNKLFTVAFQHLGPFRDRNFSFQTDGARRPV